VKYSFFLAMILVIGCGESKPAGSGGGSGGVDSSAINQPTDDGGAVYGDAADGDLTVDTAAGGSGPLTATARQWTWFDFPDSTCDDGSPTGIAVSPGDADKLLIFLNGGGACWDAVTCFVVSSSTHGPFGQAQWNATAPTLNAGIFDRSSPTNPFRDYGFVFVPYCTGDLHAGNNVAIYDYLGQQRPFHHKGAANVAAYMTRIGPTWAQATKVAVTGSSAGGFGALMNYASIRARFPDASVLLIDDAGPPLEAGAIPDDQRAAWYSAWHIGDLVDSQCPNCRDDPSTLTTAVAGKFPGDRMALLSSTQDAVISRYFKLTGPAFETDLNALKTDRLDPLPSFRTFFVTGQTHTFLGHSNTTMTGGTTLEAWLGQMASGDAGWTSVGP
jgi:hypothetical protein